MGKLAKGKIHFWLKYEAPDLLRQLRLRLPLLRGLPVTLHQIVDVSDAQEGEVVKHLLHLGVGQSDKELEQIKIEGFRDRS